MPYCLRVRWGKITIIGVGLLGGSIGLALRKRRLADEVHGFVRRKAAVEEVVRAGAADEAGTDLLRAVRGADLVIFCTPIARMKPLARQMLPALRPGALVTDVGSVKAPVVRALAPVVGKAGAQFVGSHPMAGSEKGGVGAAQAALFEEAVCVLTPHSSGSKAAVRALRRFWESIGSRVLIMDAAAHDRLVSRGSHLPHLLAAVLADMVLNPRSDPRQASLCAAGFRDTTRIAAGSPEMWRDIAMANRRNLIRDLTHVEKRIRGLREMLKEGDAAGVETVLNTACERRASWKEPAPRPCSSE